MAPDIRILAASFPDRAAADAAAVVLQRAYSPVGGVHVAALGHPVYPSPPGAVLTGRFSLDLVAAVRITVERLGGTVEMEVAGDVWR